MCASEFRDTDTDFRPSPSRLFYESSVFRLRLRVHDTVVARATVRTHRYTERCAAHYGSASASAAAAAAAAAVASAAAAFFAEEAVRVFFAFGVAFGETSGATTTLAEDALRLRCLGAGDAAEAAMLAEEALRLRLLPTCPLPLQPAER